MLDKISKQKLLSTSTVMGSIAFGVIAGGVGMIGATITHAIFYEPEYTPPTAQVSGEHGIRSVTLGPVPNNVETNGYQGEVNFEKGQKLLQTLAQVPQTVLSVEQAGQAAFAYTRSHSQRDAIARSEAPVSVLKWGCIVGAAAGFGLFGLAVIGEVQQTRRRREQRLAMAR